jgi:hypothetical protein
MVDLELKRLRNDLSRLHCEFLSLKFDLKLRKLMLALKDGFNEAQPRDEDGKWTADGGAPFDVAARGNEAACEAQYARDKITCNLVRTALCWSQAMERYSACLVGRPIPPLRF